MKHFIIFPLTALTLLILLFSFVSPINASSLSQEYVVGKIQWEQAMYPIINGTGKATILVKDSDMNKIPNFIDSLVVSIFSDSYPQGIAVTL